MCIDHNRKDAFHPDGVSGIGVEEWRNAGWQTSGSAQTSDTLAI